jgi:hypothetical protein
MNTENKTKIVANVEPNVKLSEAARLMGSIRSAAKAKTSRENGKKGGRPKKKASLNEEINGRGKGKTEIS